MANELTAILVVIRAGKYYIRYLQSLAINRTETLLLEYEK